MGNHSTQPHQELCLAFLQSHKVCLSQINGKPNLWLCLPQLHAMCTEHKRLAVYHSRRPWSILISFLHWQEGPMVFLTFRFPVSFKEKILSVITVFKYRRALEKGQHHHDKECHSSVLPLNRQLIFWVHLQHAGANTPHGVMTWV